MESNLSLNPSTMADPVPTPPASGWPPPQLALRLAGLSALAALAAGSLAALLVAWLPLASWSGPVAAMLLAAVAAPWAGWALMRERQAMQDLSVRRDGAGLREVESGMLRRETFQALAAREWARAGRQGGDVGMLIVEIDRLRPMTERSGPAVADQLLTGLGRDIHRTLRGADLLTRFGDAQLGVFLAEADPTGALDVADRIRERVERLTLPGLPPATQLTASIGVAVMRTEQQPLATILADAEAALALARQAGGNCVRMPATDRRRKTPRDHPARRKDE